MAVARVELPKSDELRHGVIQMSEFNLEQEIASARSHFASLGDAMTGRQFGDEVVKYFNQLIARNYTREQLYLIANRFSEQEIDNFPEDLLDAVVGYETGLTGRCSRKSIIRLSPALNEPDDFESFVKYVRNLRWTQDPTIRPVN